MIELRARGEGTFNLIAGRNSWANTPNFFGFNRTAASVLKIRPSFVSGLQNDPVMVGVSYYPEARILMRHLPDHGLPLVQLKEQRRDLIVALQNRNGPVSGWELMQIAAVQQAISAFEDVIADLDAEMEAAA
jgi:hypothetical protein